MPRQTYQAPKSPRRSSASGHIGKLPTVIEVECSGFSLKVPGRFSMPVHPIQLARATATMCGYAPGLSATRRAMRRGAIALEMLAQVKLVHEGSASKLVVVGAHGMERTDRSSLSHRLGVGLARVIAERQPFYLSHFYYVDGLLGGSAHRPPGIAVTWPPGASKSSADMIATDPRDRWNVIEAKGRSTQVPSPSLSARAKEQARAVHLVDARGRRIPVAMRIGSVAALDGDPVAVSFVDPPENGPGPTYTLDPAVLLWNYYEPVRDLVELYGPRLARLSGEPDFVYGFLPGTSVGLAVHRRLVEAREDPEALHAVWRELAEEWMQRQGAVSELDGYDFDVGSDGLGIVVEDHQLDELLYG
jgi:hypothetical protein